MRLTWAPSHPITLARPGWHFGDLPTLAVAVCVGLEGRQESAAELGILEPPAHVP